MSTGDEKFDHIGALQRVLLARAVIADYVSATKLRDDKQVIRTAAAIVTHLDRIGDYWLSQLLDCLEKGNHL